MPMTLCKVKPCKSDKPLTPKSMPLTGDERAKHKAQAPNSKRKKERKNQNFKTFTGLGLGFTDCMWHRCHRVSVPAPLRPGLLGLRVRGLWLMYGTLDLPVMVG